MCIKIPTKKKVSRYIHVLFGWVELMKIITWIFSLIIVRAAQLPPRNCIYFIFIYFCISWIRLGRGRVSVALLESTKTNRDPMWRRHAKTRKYIYIYKKNGTLSLNKNKPHSEWENSLLLYNVYIHRSCGGLKVGDLET